MAEPGGGSRSSEAWQCAAGGKRAVTWKRFSGASKASRVRGNLETGARGRPSAPAGPWLVHGPWKRGRGGVVQSAGRTPPDPEQVQALLSPRQQSAPQGPYCSAFLGPRPASSLPAVGWSRCPPRRREIASIIPKIPGFSLGWRGSWEKKRGGQGKSLVAAHPARLGRGGWWAPLVFPTSRWPSPPASRLPLLCWHRRDSPA